MTRSERQGQGDSNQLRLPAPPPTSSIIALIHAVEQNALHRVYYPPPMPAMPKRARRHDSSARNRVPIARSPVECAPTFTGQRYNYGGDQWLSMPVSPKEVAYEHLRYAASFICSYEEFCGEQTDDKRQNIYKLLWKSMTRVYPEAGRKAVDWRAIFHAYGDIIEVMRMQFIQMR